MGRFVKRMMGRVVIVAILFVVPTTDLKAADNENPSSPIIAKNEEGRDLGYRDPQGICPFTLETDSQSFPVGNPVYIRVTFENTTDSYAWIPVFPLESAMSCDAQCLFLTTAGVTLSWKKFPTEGMGLGGRVNPWRKILPGEKEVHYLEAAIPRPQKTYGECFEQIVNPTSNIVEMENFVQWNSIFQQGAKGRIGVTISTYTDAVDYGPQWESRIARRYPTNQEKVEPSKIDTESKEYFRDLDYFKLRGKSLTIFVPQVVDLTPLSCEHLVEYSKLCDSEKFHAALRGSVYDSKLCGELGQLVEKTPEGTLKNRLRFYQAYLGVYRLFDMKPRNPLIQSPNEPQATLKPLLELVNSFPEIEREYYKRTFIPALVYYAKRRTQMAEETLSILQNYFPDKERDSELERHLYINIMKEAWSSYTGSE